jgi:DNA-binding response OmpR family regulator
MENDQKKPMTVGELVAKIHSPVLSERQISQFQEIGKRHAEMIENVRKVAQPIIEQMNRAREQIKLFEPVEYPEIVFRRPVEYDILEELQELNKNHKRLLSSSQDSNVIIYDTTNGSLDRHLGGKLFSYDLTENGKRKQLLEILLDRGTYIKTKELELILSSSAVAKIVQTFNDYAINTLRLPKKTKLIQGKKGSGYRINPKIHIEKE